MTDFDAEFEAKLKHDEELKFKANVRRNKWLGAWAAELLGKSETESEDYIVEVIACDLDEDGEDEIVKMLVRDFAAASRPEGEAEVRAQMLRFFEEAVAEIKAIAAEAKENSPDYVPPLLPELPED